jgi:uncharacterized membrane protein SpoIIM required for sporulation
MTAMQAERQRWQDLSGLLDRVDRQGIRALSVDELKQLCRLYRQVTVDLSRARTDGDDPDLVRYLNFLAARAHGHVYRSRPVTLRPLVDFVVRDFPRLVRRRALPIGVAAAAFCLSALASALAVAREPELAYSLFDENLVEYENLRLEQHEGEYRGNFTFDVASSPFMSITLIGNNVRVACIAFALGALCCLPGLLLLIHNGRMVGTLTGLVWNHGYFLTLCSLLLTHGVVELSALCIAAGGGLMLGWSVISPGRLTRGEALRAATGEAFGLLGGAVLLLIVAGLLEAYVTPHFPAVVRWTVALLSAVLLAAYLGLAGRESSGAAALPA